MFAFKDDELVSQFNVETGRHYKQGRSPIEAAIDRVTGKDTDDAFTFSRWVTENFFGMEYAPDSSKRNVPVGIASRLAAMKHKRHSHHSSRSHARARPER